MGHGFKHGGGGGTSLNFEVVGNPQPTNPKVNTIWLNTDVPIGRWYFSATQPEGLSQGDVWFSIGTSSPVAFNALKKNGVMVYPISAKQYISGALVDVTAKSYQGGEWVGWITYLFNNGDKVDELTGGWNVVSQADKIAIGTTLKMNANVPASSTVNYIAAIATTNDIQTNGASVLNIHFVSIKAKNGNDGNYAFYVSDYSDGNSENYLASYKNLEQTDWTLSIDISKLSKIRILLGSHPWYSLGSYCNFEIDQIWFA